jgi:hypothetical protein
MYALFDQLFPRQQELHADLEVAVLDRVTESVDLGPHALRVGQCRIDVPLWLLRSQNRQRRMEWSPAGATGGNRWQMRGPQNASDKRKPLLWLATSCLSRSMVRRGCDGSSPSEGSAKAPQKIGAFLLGPTRSVINVPKVWSRLLSLQVQNCVL